MAAVGVLGSTIPTAAALATPPLTPSAPTTVTTTTAPTQAATTVTAAPSATVASTGVRVLVRGVVGGGEREVRLQQLFGRTWRTVDTATAAANGAYSLTAPTETPDIRLHRVVVPATATHAAATSRRFTVAVGEGDVRAVSYLTTPSVRWDPCTPIGYRVNLTGAPAGALKDIQRAVAETSRATGLRYRYLGTTNVVPGAESTELPDTYPADTRLVVAYATPSTSKFLGKGVDVLGMGGVFYDLTPTKVGRTTWHRAVQGYVVLDSRAELPGGFGRGSEAGILGTWGQVLMHELGHTVGLDHPSPADTAQIMHPSTTSKEARWGAGDLAGLRRLGSTSGCFPAPKARVDLALTERAAPPAGADVRPSGTRRR